MSSFSCLYYFSKRIVVQKVCWVTFFKENFVLNSYTVIIPKNVFPKLVVTALTGCIFSFFCCLFIFRFSRWTNLLPKSNYNSRGAGKEHSQIFVIQHVILAKVIQHVISAKVIQHVISAKVIRPVISAKVIQHVISAKVIQHVISAKVIQHVISAKVIQHVISAKVIQHVILAKVLW